MKIRPFIMFFSSEVLIDNVWLRNELRLDCLMQGAVHRLWHKYRRGPIHTKWWKTPKKILTQIFVTCLLLVVPSLQRPCRGRLASTSLLAAGCIHVITCYTRHSDWDYLIRLCLFPSHLSLQPNISKNKITMLCFCSLFQFPTRDTMVYLKYLPREITMHIMSTQTS
jgi:hypothetical protein